MGARRIRPQAKSSVVKLAFVSQESRMAGVEYSTLYLAGALDRSLYVPMVIAPEEGKLVSRCRSLDIPVHIVARPRFRSSSFRIKGHTLANPVTTLANGANLWRATRPLTHLLHKQEVDLLVTKGLLVHFYGGWAARQLGIPCVWHVQDEVPVRRAGGLFLRGLQLAAGALATTVVGDAESITAQFPEHPRTQTVYNGVDTTEFSPHTAPGTLRQDLNIPEEALLIGNLARLTDWKGQDILIQAFHRLAVNCPHVHLVLIGSALFDDHRYEQRLKRIAREGPGRERIHFAGYRTDIAQTLAALDIYVHPSLRKDTAPLALLSALATGLPVIISDVPGMVEVVDDEVTGLIFSAGDANQLNMYLSTLVNEPALRGDMGYAARKAAIQRFSIDAHARQMTAVFEEAISGIKRDF